MASYAVTPNAALAGRTEQTGTPEFPANIFYVDPDEFAEFTRELTALSEIASDGNPELQRDELIDRSVIRFIDDRVLGSPLLTPEAPAPSADEIGDPPNYYVRVGSEA
jgi:hypothetical protein